jgi:hypothetical protein
MNIEFDVVKRNQIKKGVNLTCYCQIHSFSFVILLLSLYSVRK